jgi:[ribosomal protein S5]-alanine N-acetyltransferase
MHNPFLIGNCIYLRPLERGDAAAFVAWFNDPEVNRFLLRHNPLTLAAEEDWLERVLRSEDAIFGIVLKEGDQLIGGTGLHEFDWRCRHAAFGINIGAKSLWGQGHGSEATALVLRHAFQTLNLNRVWLHVYEYNPRGIRVYEKLGFHREGVLRQHTFRDGRHWDTIAMGILRAEWEEQNGTRMNAD